LMQLKVYISMPWILFKAKESKYLIMNVYEENLIEYLYLFTIFYH
jgi:hypothetical protein